MLSLGETEGDDDGDDLGDLGRGKLRVADTVHALFCCCCCDCDCDSSGVCGCDCDCDSSGGCGFVEFSGVGVVGSKVDTFSAGKAGLGRGLDSDESPFSFNCSITCCISDTKASLQVELVKRSFLMLSTNKPSFFVFNAKLHRFRYLFILTVQLNEILLGSIFSRNLFTTCEVLLRMHTC